MTEYEYRVVKMFSELFKNSIDNNPNFDEWEKWWRKTGIEATVQFAEQIYNQKKKH